MKKIIALLLAIIMAVGVFAGCGQNDDPVGTTQAPAASNQDNNPTDAQNEEPVKLQFMINCEIDEGSIGDAWVKELEEHCNVEIEWISPAASAYEENLQLMLLDEDRPDAVIFPTAWLNSTSFADACEDGMFISLENMIQDYENIMAHTAQVSWDGLDIFDDGRIVSGVFPVPPLCVQTASCSTSSGWKP